MRIAVRFLYALLAVFSAGLLLFGRSYFFIDSAKRVRHPLYPLLRQSGSLGHFLGILGMIFMVLLLLYSLRKRLRFMKNWGHIGFWLDVHIFLGFSGPVLILFHTNFEFSGLVALSFWAMTLVVLSGIVGRHFYRLIPRSLSGMELNRIELEAEEIGMTFEMRKSIPAGDPFWQVLRDLENQSEETGRRPAIFRIFRGDEARRILNGALKKIGSIDKKGRRRLMKLVLKRHRLLKRIRLIERTLKILHYWHLVHQPFVIVMFLISIVHIFISWQMGQRWMF